MLIPSFTGNLAEAGCDEAGRGCLAGPVFAAAVIFPVGYSDPGLNDSKKLTPGKRDELRRRIEKDALAWAVATASPGEIDAMNILNASIRAMHRAISLLGIRPGLILADGNRFHPYPAIPHRCIVRGDSLYQTIAAASVLAKTFRDDYMTELHKNFPEYGWDRNKGYPSVEHRNAVQAFGMTVHHRKTFRIKIYPTFAP